MSQKRVVLQTGPGPGVVLREWGWDRRYNTVQLVEREYKAHVSAHRPADTLYTTYHGCPGTEGLSPGPYGTAARRPSPTPPPPEGGLGVWASLPLATSRARRGRGSARRPADTLYTA